MRRIVCALLVGLVSAPVTAQELPRSVSEAYLAYEVALEQRDFTAASAAAETAFAEARTAALDDSLQLTLGLNALAMAPARGRGSGLVSIVEAVSVLAIDAGEPETARDAYLQGLAAAGVAENGVAFSALQDGMMDALLAHGLLGDTDQPRLFEVQYPISFPEPFSETLRSELEVERAAQLTRATDPVLIANLTLLLRRDAMLRENRDAALAMTDEATRVIDPSTVEGRLALAALVEGLPQLTDILTSDGSTLPDALAPRAPETRRAICAYLASRPVPIGPWREVRVPLQAPQRGRLHAVASVNFDVRDGAFWAIRPSPDASPPRDSHLLQAIQANLSATGFHTDCVGNPVSRAGRFRVAYTGMASGRRGSATRFSFRLLQSIRPVDGSDGNPDRNE